MPNFSFLLLEGEEIEISADLKMVVLVWVPLEQALRQGFRCKSFRGRWFLKTPLEEGVPGWEEPVPTWGGLCSGQQLAQAQFRMGVWKRVRIWVSSIVGWGNRDIHSPALWLALIEGCVPYSLSSEQTEHALWLGKCLLCWVQGVLNEQSLGMMRGYGWDSNNCYNHFPVCPWIFSSLG